MSEEKSSLNDKNGQRKVDPDAWDAPKELAKKKNSSKRARSSSATMNEEAISPLKKMKNDNGSSVDTSNYNSGYPESFGALLEGIRGDIDTVVETGVTMFSAAFSFFSTNESREAQASEKARRKSKRRGAHSKSSQQSIDQEMALARQNDALKLRLPSLWSSGASSNISEVSNTIKEAAAAVKAPKPSSRVKAGGIVNLSILNTKTALNSFSCIDDGTLVLGVRRMIMTRPIDETDEEYCSLTDAQGRLLDGEAKMGKVVWSQILHEIEGYSSKEVSNGVQLVFTSLVGTPAVEMVFPDKDSESQFLTALRKNIPSLQMVDADSINGSKSSNSSSGSSGSRNNSNRNGYAVDCATEGRSPVRGMVAAIEAKSTSTVAHKALSMARAPIQYNEVRTSDSQASEKPNETRDSVILLTPGTYTKCDVCVRQLRHGVGEAGIRRKLLSDGLDEKYVDEVIRNAQNVQKGASLGLVPGNKRISIIPTDDPADATISITDCTTDANTPQRKQEDTEKTTLGKASSVAIPSTAMGRLSGVANQDGGSGSCSEQRVPNHLRKYAMMLRVGLPHDIIRHKMTMDTVSEEQQELRPDTSVDHQIKDEATKSLSAAGPAVTMIEHSIYSKFFKMLKVGLPAALVKNKMAAEGLDPAILDRSPDEPAPASEADADTTTSANLVPLSEHPTYTKFFKMLKVGLPPPAIKNKMAAEGLDPAILDRNSDKNKPQEKPIKPIKSQPRKKKFHWNALDSHAVPTGSLWAEDHGEVVAIDEDEFNSLFVEVIKSPKREEQPKAKAIPKKQTVYLVDMKKGQNIAISLARIKVSFLEIREHLDSLDDSPFSPEQLASMEEALPSAEEISTLQSYQGDHALLGQAEKFMLEMSQCKSASQSLACLRFKHFFGGKLAEISASIAIVQEACDKVKSSVRLKKVLKTVLQVGNQMNGNGSAAGGFSLDSLLKLSSAKAFDKKTSLLQYIIMLLHRSEPDSLKLKEDLEGLSNAARLHVGFIDNEVAALRKGVECTQKTFHSYAGSEGMEGFPAMLAFLDSADAQMETIQEELQTLQAKFTDMLSYFGDCEGKTSETFFSTLHKFAQEFASAKVQFERQKKSADAKAAKQKLAERKASNSVCDKENKQTVNSVLKK
eukprot:GSChrysophyteH1.ASY1.ANO1.1137.1 assembled CDS